MVLAGYSIGQRVSGRVSNGTGHCNFLGQRGRSSIIVPGQRDNLKILPLDGTAYPNPGRDVGQADHYFSVKIWDGTRDGTITIFVNFFAENGIRVQN